MKTLAYIFLLTLSFPALGNDYSSPFTVVLVEVTKARGNGLKFKCLEAAVVGTKEHIPQIMNMEVPENAAVATKYVLWCVDSANPKHLESGYSQVFRDGDFVFPPLVGKKYTWEELKKEMLGKMRK